ncbi:MAG: hypothetical protein JOZ77_10635 [Candidatus Eremiobacteraeota bacterium]|nr:hypothetical protein [Candidatus Eremiobacteraeota bacterium]
MRLVLTAALCAFFTLPAVAQTSPPGYTQFDLTQQAKLRSHLGTWRCVSVPGATTISTETQQGNWFVTRRAGSNSATSYERWSHVLKAYIDISIFDSGASDIAQTTSLDPDNATYIEMWPALDNQGRKRFDIQVSRTGDAMRSSSQFYDEQGNVRNAVTTCTKQ